MVMMALERDFEDAMLDLYHAVTRVLGRPPTRLLNMICQHGGVEAAKVLLNKPDVSMTYSELHYAGRPDLTVEALVLSERWQSLFTDEELEIARRRSEE